MYIAACTMYGLLTGQFAKMLKLGKTGSLVKELLKFNIAQLAGSVISMGLFSSLLETCLIPSWITDYGRRSVFAAFLELVSRNLQCILLYSAVGSIFYLIFTLIRKKLSSWKAA